MQPIRLLSVAEQTAAHLRQGLAENRWNRRMPGVVRLARECDVSTGVARNTVRIGGAGMERKNGGGQDARATVVRASCPEPSIATQSANRTVLGVARAALHQLEAEGLLTSRGLGRSRSISVAVGTSASLRKLRVGILLHDAPRNRIPQTSQILLEVRRMRRQRAAPPQRPTPQRNTCKLPVY